MESEGSLPCSQKPVTGPYPEPDESSLHILTLRKSHFHKISHSHPCLGLPNDLLLSDFPTKDCTHFWFACYLPSQSHSCSVSPNNIWWGIQLTELLIMPLSPGPFYFIPRVVIFSPAPYSQAHAISQVPWKRTVEGEFPKQIIRFQFPRGNKSSLQISF
jgi:hypothetical protein